MLKALLLLGGIACSQCVYAGEDSEHDKVVNVARQGNYKQALSMLDTIVKEKGWDEKRVYDYITILTWDGQYQKAYKLFKEKVTKDPKELPGHVLEALARSCRELKYYQKSRTFYLLLMKKHPKDVDAYLGLAVILLTEDKADDVPLLLVPFKNDPEKGVEVLKLMGLAYMRLNLFIDALDCYTRALAKKHNDKEALQGKAKALNGMLASYEAEKIPDLDADLYQKIKSSEAALDIRWGIASEYPRNYAHFDKAIDKLTKAEPTDRNTYDLIVAYNRRGRHDDALRLYEELLASGKTKEDIPNETLEAVAVSYLHKHNPVIAKDIYGFVLSKQADNIEALQGYYYALLENEELGESLEFIESNYQKHKKFIYMGKLAYINSNRDACESLYSKSFLYANLLSVSESVLKERIKVIPHNTDIRMLLGETYLSRGLPRAAKKEFDIGQTNDPENVGLKIGRIGVLMSLHQYREAEALLNELKPKHPDNDALKKAEKAWEAHNLRELDTGYSFQKGGLSSSGTSLLEATLYSSPIAYNFRAFMTATHLFGKFTEGSLWYILGGAGLEYKSTPFNARFEVNDSHYKGRARVGSILDINITPTDEWAFSGQADFNSSAKTPGRAFVNEVSSNYFDVGAGYYYNNAFKLGMSVFDQEFTDKNRWFGGSSFVQGQVAEMPRQTLDLRLDLGYRKSRTQDALYYSPLRDSFASASAILDQTLYRNYEFSFKHAITPSAGEYWERGFNKSATFGVSYEQQFGYQDWYLFKYGVSRARATYDGTPEYTTSVFINFNIKF
ncbi:MAG: poly-beta-1,6 N-acetyl-D-glucosamine export porin PgaA [Alphaproteobacteria bacterium]